MKRSELFLVSLCPVVDVFILWWCKALLWKQAEVSVRQDEKQNMVHQSRGRVDYNQRKKKNDLVNLLENVIVNSHRECTKFFCKFTTILKCFFLTLYPLPPAPKVIYFLLYNVPNMPRCKSLLVGVTADQILVTTFVFHLDMKL